MSNTHTKYATNSQGIVKIEAALLDEVISSNHLIDLIDESIVDGYMTAIGKPPKRDVISGTRLLLLGMFSEECKIMRDESTGREYYLVPKPEGTECSSRA
jgi:hypothetical protein